MLYEYCANIKAHCQLNHSECNNNNNKEKLTKVAGTNGGTVSKYPTVLVYDRSRKYTARNITPNKHKIPPHTRHHITYFRTPDGWGTENKKVENNVNNINGCVCKKK